MKSQKPALSGDTPPGHSTVKRMLAYQIEREMARQGLTRARMAERMGTSRAALNRLLDPQNNSVTLQTMLMAAEALGKQVQIFLDDDTQGAFSCSV
ncbi:MAG: XRE family transcriptional regulator [Bdellovibrionales bacterium]